MSALVAPPAFGDFTNLDDEMVKLVAYTIVLLQRDREMILPGGQDQTLVKDRMTGDDFVAQLIAQYAAKRLYATTLTDAEWDRARKYLRVYYVVSQRWPREPMKFEERQIRVLEEVRDRI
jgi:hypothetical protein